MAITLDGTKGGTFPTWTTAGRPASPSTGQTGYNTTLGTMEVYSGAAWEPLVTTNDSGSVSSAMLASSSVTTVKIADANVTPDKLSQKLTRMSAQNTTSGTTIDFTSIPSWARRITIAFNGVSLNGTAYIMVQIGTGGTPTTSGYTGGTTALANAAITNAASVSGFPLFGAAAAYVQHGLLTLVNVSGNVWVASGNFWNVPSVNFATIVAGGVSLAGVLDMVRITSSNGTDTFDAGSVNVMYEG